MAVKEVYMPGTGKTIDPVTMKPQGPNIDWEKKAAEMEARSKYALAEKELKSLENPPPPTPQESGIHIKGDIDVGHIDLMEQSRVAQAKMQEIQDKYEQQIASISDSNEHYRDQVNELRLEMMQKQFNLQLETVMQQLKNNNGNGPGTILQQVESIKAIASQLGYSPASTAVTDSGLQLQILKMQNDAAREEREFQWKMKQDEWNREARLKEIEQSGNVQMEVVRTAKERNNLIASAFDLIGQSIARGIMAGGEVDTGIAEQPQRPPAGQPKQFKIEAEVGQSGEIPCPNCQAPLAVLATTETAVCARCGSKFPVVRSPAEAKGQKIAGQLSEEEAERAG